MQDLSGTGGTVNIDASTLTAGTGNSTTYAGAIIGHNGSFIKTGNGTLTLLGVNTYTGLTDIQGGTLALRGSSSIADSANIHIANGATLDVSAVTTPSLANVNADQGSNLLIGGQSVTLGGASGSATFAGNISGLGGSLTKTGGSRLILTGTNNYNGYTQVNGGILQVGDASTLGSLAGNVIVVAGTLDISNANVDLSQVTSDSGSTIQVGNRAFTLTVPQTFNGSIQDGGITGATGASLTMNGASNTDVLALNRVNTYSGGTILQNGMIAISNNQGLGTGTFEFAGTGGATLQLAQALSGPIANAIQMTSAGNLDTQGFDVELSGTITGNATLTKLGSGLLTLSGPNYNNGVIHQNGTIAIGNNQSLGVGNFTFDTAGDILQISSTLTNVSNPVVLVQDGTINTAGNNANFSGQFTGTGGLTKNGNGVLQLSNADNTYSGATLVDAGELKANGTLKNSDVTIASGASFSGNNTVNSLTNRETVAPGNSIGQIEVNGNFNNTNGVYQCEINANGQSDLIQVLGTATLGGTVNVMPDAGSYISGTTYTILTAVNPITTQFDALTSTSALLQYKLAYTTNSVLLTVIRQASIGSIVTSGNAGTIAGYIDGLGTPPAGSVLANLEAALSNLSGDALYNALNQLHPAPNVLIGAAIVATELDQADGLFEASFTDRLIRKVKKRLNDKEAQGQTLGLAIAQGNIPLAIGLTNVLSKIATHSETHLNLVPKTREVPQNLRTTLGKSTFWGQQTGRHFSQDAKGINPNLAVRSRSSRFIQAKGGGQLSGLFDLNDVQLYLYAKLGYTYKQELGTPQGVTTSFAGYGNSFTVFVNNKRQNSKISPRAHQI
ncbi:autotransporter-associated beta strand repeat-containing protein [Candidatus Paracaedibacter symbiosus]|uniref:autotransporter-associated beta strand repeat-containing protein n=1 Tax=Candidatus Paracaedibacter symbiosus TaxID=244582 RepID=UPI002A4E14BD|nr:autotransporter-associated beta strand repeat-containing protein [Candidatus Paracaedibacter symbiosus]